MRNPEPALAGRYKNRVLGILPQVLNEVTGVLGDKKRHLKNCNPRNPHSVVQFGGIPIIPFFRMNLKQIYETARGQPISDRQWRTIVCQLDLGMLLDPVAAVRTAAWLRRVAPKARLSRDLLIQVKDLERAFPLDACMTREDLWRVIQDRLRVCPSLPTLYRWGDELGHTRSDQILLPEDIRFWLLKLLSWKTKPHGNYQTNCRPSQSFARNRRAKAA